MNSQLAVDLLRHSLWVALEISGPLLLVGLLVGVAVSLFAAVTQIQDMTLTFIPKLAAMAFVALIIAPWALKILIGFTSQLFAQAAQIAPAGH